MANETSKSSKDTLARNHFAQFGLKMWEHRECKSWSAESSSICEAHEYLFGWEKNTKTARTNSSQIVNCNQNRFSSIFKIQQTLLLIYSGLTELTDVVWCCIVLLFSIFSSSLCKRVPISHCNQMLLLQSHTQNIRKSTRNKKNIDDETEKNTKQQQITALYDSMGLTFENALPFALWCNMHRAQHKTNIKMYQWFCGSVN